MLATKNAGREVVRVSLKIAKNSLNFAETLGLHIFQDGGFRTKLLV